jgi:hypothetical protein
LFPIADLRKEGAEAAVAVGLERAHAQLLGQGEGLAEVISGLLALQRLTLHRQLTEELNSIGFMTSFLVVTGMFEGAGGGHSRPLQAAGAQMRPAQGGEQRRPRSLGAAQGGLL